MGRGRTGESSGVGLRRATHRARLLGAGFLALLLFGLACASDAAPQVAQEPQQPAAAADPAPAAAAPDPAAATGAAVSAPTRPAAMPAPSVPAATGEPKYGGTLILGHRQDPPLGFDTMRYSGVSTIQVAASIWGNGHLVKPCRENIFNVCPGLAESWEHNDDFTQWTFKVRDNVLWHDGTRMVPEDIKFWLELFVNGVEVGDKKRGPSPARLDFEPLESVEVLPGNQLSHHSEFPQGPSTSRWFQGRTTSSLTRGTSWSRVYGRAKSGSLPWTWALWAWDPSCSTGSTRGAGSPSGATTTTGRRTKPEGSCRSWTASTLQWWGARRPWTPRSVSAGWTEALGGLDTTCPRNDRRAMTRILAMTSGTQRSGSSTGAAGSTR